MAGVTDPEPEPQKCSHCGEERRGIMTLYEGRLYHAGMTECNRAAYWAQKGKKRSKGRMVQVVGQCSRCKQANGTLEGNVWKCNNCRSPIITGPGK